MNHEEDILETALNSGIRFAAQKHSVTEQQVREIVQKFKDEIESIYEDECLCRQQMKEGKAPTQFCFMPCPPDAGQRIKL